MHHGRISLSFVGTLGDRASAPSERLTDPSALSAWLTLAGLQPPNLPVTPAALRRAIRLREAIARTVAAIHAGDHPPAADVASINAAAKNVAPIALDPQTLRAVTAARDPIYAALAAIARDAIELLTNEEERKRLRTCALPTCASIFLTPAGRRPRRWCSMPRCGNRAKVAAWRKRS
jgi:predicted RNA-binding Zn ribbon-like protein